MRSTIVAAAFAATAVAVPYHGHQHQHKRDEVVDVVTASEVDVVYVTDVVTVTAGAEPTETPAAYTHKTHKHWTWGGWSSKPESSAAAPTETYAPPPPTTTSVYVPPTTSSTSVYVAPTTSAVESSSAPESSPATTAAPTSAAPAKPTTYSQTVVYHHNIHRKNHTAQPIAWDQGLANTALEIAQSCVYAHNVEAGGGGYGQNIAAGVEPNNVSAIITNMMYNGEMGWYSGLYGQDSPDMTNFEHWGHFSQIVWADTTHVGCATYDCSAQGLANTGSDVAPYFTVCNYSPPGNFAGEYTNVKSPLGYPTANWNTGCE